MENSIYKTKPSKRILSVLLSIIIAFGTFVTITFGNTRFQNWLGVRSMLSAYAAEIVDTKGAVAVDEKSMLADNHIIDLENRDGSNTVYLFSEPISFTDENGDLKTKDISVEKQKDSDLKSDGYAYANGQNDYRINFSEDKNKGVRVNFDDCEYTIIPQSTLDAAGKKSESEYLNEKFEIFEYPSIYGESTSLKFYPQLNGVKDEIVLDKNIGQNAFSFTLKTNNCTAVLNDDGTVSLKNKDGKSVQTFFAPFAYDSEYVEGEKDEHYSDCKYTLEKAGENTYKMTVCVDKEWLGADTTKYPIVIDPTTSNISNSADAGVYSKKSSNNYGSEQTCCFGRASQYGYGRVYSKFTMPSAIKKGAIINSAYQWERETTGRTTSTKVTAYLANSSWSESGINWSNKPGYNSSVASNTRTISSKSTDDSSNSYWYKFNIKNLVQKWASGTANNGMVFLSSEEKDGAYNWRAFTSRTYSSSAMRPYTVINYTNDTTAPTIKSVTGNATAWTNGNVTLKINGAADNSGGAGLHATPYSFSTTKGRYSWQSSNTKAFSSNCTVYVYVRDAVGNIALVKTETINKIDKTVPTKPTVSKSTSEWTNGTVTVSANSSDTQSGVKYYSFSTEKGVYAWQTASSKAFSENTSVYVYAKDAANNISQASDEVKIENIDKTAPSAPQLSGEYDKWYSDSVEITAESTDTQSGIDSYSFSESETDYKWQSDNKFNATGETKLFVCAKDKAGNISQPTSVDLKNDKLSPTGSISANVPTDWVTSVEIKATATDELSGLADEPYSFGTEEGVYNWQESDTYTARQNGTYYVYAKDNAGNITLLDKITLDKIDSTAPTISNISSNINDFSGTLTVTAADEQSGIAGYSFDGGKTWQTSNVFDITNYSENTIVVKAKDLLGNTSQKKYTIYTPQVFFDENKAILYSTNHNADNNIFLYDKISIPVSSYLYSKPLMLSDGQKYLNVAFKSEKFPANYKRIDVSEHSKVDYNKQFYYTETVSDYTTTFNTVNFSVSRQYRDGKWTFSTDNKITFENENIITAVMPDFNKLYFIKANRYQYVDKTTNSKITVVYDESDKKIVEYIVSYNNTNYHYNTNGVLTEIGSFAGDAFSLSYGDSEITVTDASGRKTVLSIVGGMVASICDAAGNKIKYDYDNSSNLVKVTDQAGVILSEYKYDGSKLVKSNLNNISYDDLNRVEKITADNGYYTTYEYSQEDGSDFTVTVKSADGSSKQYSYDKRNMLSSSVNEYGDNTTYYYNSNQTLQSEYISDTNKTTYQYKRGTVFPTNINDHTSSTSTSGQTYYYDDQNRLITEDGDDGRFHYVYDDNNQVIIKATVKDKYNYSKNEFDESDLSAYYLTKYEYDGNGLVTKVVDEAEKTATFYQYDEHGYAVCITTTSTENDSIQSVVSYEYDITGNILSTNNEDGKTEYVYDAAGRVLLSKTADGCQRTVYDKYGRTVQTVTGDEYKPELDTLPGEYGDKNVGARSIYDDKGNLIKEINADNLETDYTYSDVGVISKKHFDIYDYYFNNQGKCDKIAVNGVVLVTCLYRQEFSDTKESFYNKITYANGYVERQVTDKYGNVYRKINVNANSKWFYSLSADKSNSKAQYLAEGELNTRTHITSSSSGYKYEKEDNQYGGKVFFSYAVKSQDGNQTVTELHNGKNYTTTIADDSVSFESPASSFTCKTESADNSGKFVINNGEQDVLTADVSFNSDKSILKKSYGIDGFDFTSTFDESSGTIKNDESNAYTYDKLGQLVSTSGAVNSSYTYDKRGNMTSKTVDGTTVDFEYTNAKWQDQLTAVGGKTLEYDANGNLQSYDGTVYTWAHNNRLGKISRDDKNYYYYYDSSGIRAEKTVDGVTTSFDTMNGVVLSQSDGTDDIYFQYSNGVPVGFLLNDVQYYYVTDLSGNVKGITDANGELVASYEYDEWGKLLALTPAEDGNEEQIAVATKNPLRYRGYYYDNETGLYYLQSRYYSPDLCRFISPDDFEYINNSSVLYLNAYAYCYNNAVSLSDAEGTTPQLAMNVADISAFVKHIGAKAKETAKESLEKAKALLNKTVEKLKETWAKLEEKRSQAIKDIKYFIDNPDVVISQKLSKLLHKEVKVRFRLLEYIRATLHKKRASKYYIIGTIFGDEDCIPKKNKDNESNSSSKAKAKAKSKNDDSNNIVNAILQGLIAAIELDWINELLKSFGSSLDQLAKISFEATKEVSLAVIAIMNTAYLYLKNSFSLEALSSIDGAIIKKGEKMAKKSGSNLIDAKGFGTGFGIFTSILAFIAGIDSAGSGKTFSKSEDIVMNAVNAAIGIACLFIPEFISPIVAFLIPIISNIGMDVAALRIKGLIFEI